MIIAVTGGTGFIGRKLVARLVQLGHKVRVATRNPNQRDLGIVDVEYITIDLSNPSTSSLKRLLDGADLLFNCAGEISDATKMRKLHVDGVAAIANVAHGRIKRWVQLSSVGVYGDVSNGHVCESAPLRPVGEYEVSKCESELLVAKLARKFSFDYVVLRPSNVYGLDMPNRSLISLVDVINRGLFFFIGKRCASANYIHVDNVVEALLLCGFSKSAVGEVYNLSDSRCIEVFVSAICGGLGIRPPRLRFPRLPVLMTVKFLSIFMRLPISVSRVNALTNRATYSFQKICIQLGYRHIVSMESGVQEFARACAISARIG